MKYEARRLLIFSLILSRAIESGAQANFTSSNLPIVVITTTQFIQDTPKVSGEMGIIDNGPGVRNNLTDPFNDFSGKIGIEIRGSSSQMFPKKQYGVEVRDANGDGIDASLLGMPEKDDWVLFAPYDDKSLMRDVLAYKLGREMGDYASRSRYCELVLNGSYEGVYVLLEKIKRDKYRVNIDKLDPAETTGDNVTGGYIIKIDKTSGSGGDGWFSSFTPLGRFENQTIYFLYDYPKAEDIVPEQKTYIQNTVDAFEKALAGDDFKDPVKGYAHYIDVPSFVDFFIASEITKNPDAYRLSTYLYKKKDSNGGKLFMGPIWDFNLGFGNVDYCSQGNPEGFVMYYNSICPDDYWLVPFWWDRLFKDDAFRLQVSARWTSLRKGPYQTATILNYVDSVATMLDEAKDRNFLKWQVLGQYVWPNYFVGSSYAQEIEWLKNWIKARLIWMDENIPAVITGVNERTSGFSIRAFPNPFAEDIRMEYEIDRPGMLTVDLFDLLGRKLDHVERNNETEGTYNLIFHPPGLSTGTYIFKARFGSLVVTEKVIKKQ